MCRGRSSATSYVSLGEIGFVFKTKNVTVLLMVLGSKFKFLEFKVNSQFESDFGLLGSDRVTELRPRLTFKFGQVTRDCG